MRSDRRFSFLIALAGAVGVVVLIGSFMVNPAPPPGANAQDVLEFGRQHATTVLVAGWMQGIGSLLNVAFAFGLVHLAGSSRRFSGWMTMLSGGTILSISLVECSLYFAAVDAGRSGDTTALMTVLTLIRGLQHVYLIAPALLLPVGWTLLQTPVLPRLFAITALLIGATLQLLGLAGVLYPLQPVVDALLIVQGVWFLAASIALGVLAIRSSAVGVRGHGAISRVHA